MEISLLRQLWSIVESFPNHRLSSLDDSSLLRSLIDSLQSDPSFEPHHLPVVRHYILTRLPLIREISQQM
ncbi:MAG: hypothetical protein HC800_19485 [Phormidesmis sp. RL_2_1]|nr:hypothetical protein [Phormidesmis sp. RL_2_1]